MFYDDIYVYNKEKYFAVFLIKKISKKYCIINLNDVKLMKSENFKDTNVGFFIANNVNDVVAIFRFRECFNEKIILCSENVSLTEKYSKTFPIPCLDISRP